MGKLILTNGAQVQLAPVIFGGHHKVLAPPMMVINGTKGHTTIDGQKVFTVDDINDLKVNVVYITLKGHSIPGQGRIEIDASKIIKASHALSEKSLVLHDNKLPLKFTVTAPAKMPGTPPQDDPLSTSTGDAPLVPRNTHVFADN